MHLCKLSSMTSLCEIYIYIYINSRKEAQTVSHNLILSVLLFATYCLMKHVANNRPMKNQDVTSHGVWFLSSLYVSNILRVTNYGGLKTGEMGCVLSNTKNSCFGSVISMEGISSVSKWLAYVLHDWSVWVRFQSFFSTTHSHGDPPSFESSR
jgi:hypothetical protein